MLRYLNFLLYPFSLLYGLVMWIRNRLYDKGLLTAVEFDLPVIAAGNLSVGGTGKTPHVEYMIRLLKDHLNVATLSRGYNRRTSGYLLADEHSTAADIGDEPMQFHDKFPDIKVCVGEERMLAIPQLLGDEPNTQVILLDDAFQHRSIKPGMNIMITDYSRLFTRDHVVPFGRLREGRAGYHRANCIIVSKCPPDMSPAEKAALEKEINPLPHQRLFFTTLQYGALSDMVTHQPVEIPPSATVLLACGIARPEPLLDELKRRYDQVYLLSFPDHYYYTEKDIAKIKKECSDLPGTEKIVITTEKDAVRLHLLKKELAEQNLRMAVIPVEVSFLFGEAELFNNFIFDYISRHLPAPGQ
ncbi:lipid-A-disaccharide kinase [Chitinophaga polysaccharea]|uniref:Tetraacyldisaccharide 4'-kinase n=1 Tax=Chitinophaga polysaccharea TaxID=1293035 RepID=A0A561PWB6_9BACT|nr:tetraacyldisaccharide 4'-kinase [Chitinophaga polysaccharea]TWF42411.1 lipid-A-disaccharide kinase [Chitinophaga polysaccharea]